LHGADLDNIHLRHNIYEHQVNFKERYKKSEALV
jgi:hypothetical protein